MAGYKDKGWVCDIPKNKYYVYALFDLNGFPFYIGKGRNQRVNSHVKPYLLAEHSHKNHKIKAILEKQGYLKREILVYCDNEEDAYMLEESIIASYGLRSNGGCLTNVLYNNRQLSKKALAKQKEQSKKARQVIVSDMDIIAAYEDYKTKFIGVGVLSARLGISDSYLNAIFAGRKRADLNLTLRKERPITCKVTWERAAGVIKDRELGLTYSELMVKYELPKTTVARICKGVGVYASLRVEGTGNGTGKSVSTRDNAVSNLEGTA